MRPAVVRCGCGSRIPVGARGRLPTECAACKIAAKRGTVSQFYESEAVRRAQRPRLADHPLVSGTGRARPRARLLSSRIQRAA